MRIGIDARKLHDFGIGTYLRNLLRFLARLDTTTDYVLFCRKADVEAISALAVRKAGGKTVRWAGRAPVPDRFPEAPAEPHGHPF